MPHNGPIQSRVEVFCWVCGNDFEAKRSDAKYCLSCRKGVAAKQTKESGVRNRDRRNAQERERERRKSKEKRELENQKLREKWATDAEYREYRKRHHAVWASIHGNSGAQSKEQRQRYQAAYYAKHKQEHNRRRVERRRAQPFCKDECERCGIDDPRVLDVHHKIPLSEGGTGEQSNLETLCKNCHAIAHWEARERL